MRRLLVMRHAQAGDREEAARRGLSDALRPLTPAGVSHMREVAAGLHRLLPEIRLILASPLLRALQSAEILSAACGHCRVTAIEALMPDTPPLRLAQALEEPLRQGTCGIVGHEPGLSLWIGWALAGVGRSLVRLKKGGAALLEFPNGPHEGLATLQWLLTPSQLRAIGSR